LLNSLSRHFHPSGCSAGDRISRLGAGTDQGHVGADGKALTLWSLCPFGETLHFGENDNLEIGYENVSFA
jgi:hypothetical protein